MAPGRRLGGRWISAELWQRSTVVLCAVWLLSLLSSGDSTWGLPFQLAIPPIIALGWMVLILVGLRAERPVTTAAWTRCTTAVGMTLLVSLWSRELFLVLGQLALGGLLVLGGMVLVLVTFLRAVFTREAPQEPFETAVTWLRHSSLLCSALLLSSLWPGIPYGADTGVVFLSLGAALALGWVLLALEALLHRLLHGGWRSRTIELLAAGLLLGMTTAALLWFRVPRRAAFTAFREELKTLVEDPTLFPGGERMVGRFVGPWYVDVLRADERGGVYLRTWTSYQFVDTVSYGFAFRPNETGSPFGAAGYGLRPVARDWSEFSASDDW